jgi:hypothetical protein
MVTFKFVQSFFIKTVVITQEEVDLLCQQLLAEMMLNDFSAVWFYLRAWGEVTAK